MGNFCFLFLPLSIYCIVPAEVDLLGFDSPTPAPVPAVQSSTVDASEEFAAFGQMRSTAAATGPDPFASAPAPSQHQEPAFDAFGNNSSSGVYNNQTMNNTMSVASNFNTGAKNNAANQLQDQLTQTSNDDNFGDDFGDFNECKRASYASSSGGVGISLSATAAGKTSSDPIAGLINLDGLSKNPSQKMTMNSAVVVDAAAANYQKDMQQAAQGFGVNRGSLNDGVVSAGGSDAISSMFGPTTPQPQKQQRSSMSSLGLAPGGMNQQLQQQQYMMNQMQNQEGVQGNNSMNMMLRNPQMQGLMGMNNINMSQMGMNSMNNTNTINQMNMNQMVMNQNMNHMEKNNPLGFQQNQSFNPQWEACRRDKINQS